MTKQFETEKSESSKPALSDLMSLLEAVPEAIITADELGSIVSFNQAAENLFGYSAEEVSGQNIKMLMPSPYRDDHDRYMEHYKKTAEKNILGIGRDLEAQRKDGLVFPIHLSINEMLIDGRKVFTGVVRDLTDLKNAQRQNAQIARILDSSLQEIYVFAEDTLKFIKVNYGARKNTGYSSKAFRSLTPLDMIPQLTEHQFAALLNPLRDGTKELLVFKTVHRRKDGSTYPVEAHMQLMRDEEPPFFLAIVQDVTESERREDQYRQAQKMESIGQLTGGIAHDFNNLLTVIIGNNEILAELLTDEFQRELLDDATGAAEHAAQLTNQLLAFARKQPLDPQILQINELIEDMSEMLSRTLGEAILFRSILAPDIRYTLADPMQVHTAVLNMAINARDAMPNGGELIVETSNADIDADSAAMRSDALPGQYVRLSVRDTGRGMTPDVQARILEPFFTTKDKGKGTGLGLSMVHGFAKQSGGFVEVYSELGYGTAISFYLPVADNEDVDTERLMDSGSTDLPVGRMVLVVEDDPRVRGTTLKRLKRLGYQTQEAESGPEALEILAQNQEIDLVFSDMIMPGGMTGADLIEIVQKEHPNVKCLMTSGYAEDGIIPNHGTRWLRKPYSIQKLAETLNEVLE